MEDVALPSIPSHVRLSSSMTRPTVVGTVAEIITYVIQSIEPCCALLWIHLI